MTLDVKQIKELRDLLNVNDMAEHLGELNSLLSELNKEYIHACVRNYVNKDREELERIEIFAQKIEKLFEKSLKSDAEKVIHEMGTFKGANLLLYYLRFNMNQLETVKRKIQVLSEQRHIKDILLFLYENPSSRHKKIAETLGLGANYLSELMRKLENAGCVERYQESKYSYYELTIDGRSCVREMFYIPNECDTQKRRYPEQYLGKTSSEEKRMYKTEVRIEEIEEKERIYEYQRYAKGYDEMKKVPNWGISGSKNDSKIIHLNKYRKTDIYSIEN